VLAIAASVLLAFVPRLPSSSAPGGLGLASGTRMTASTNRRLRVFATAQIALSFVLLAGAGMLLATLVSQQTAATGYDVRHVLVFDIPPAATGTGGAKAVTFYQEAIRRVAALPGVDGAAVGVVVPWRDSGVLPGGATFAVDGYQPENGEAPPRARVRIVSPGFFGVMGVRLLEGREFTDDDRVDSEPVSIISQSVAQRLFPNGGALNRQLTWTDPYLGRTRVKRRIVGIVADVDDEHVVPEPSMAIYQPSWQFQYGGRLFLRTAGDPYSLVPAVTRTIRGISADQPVERAATLDDIRAQVLSPERVSAFVFSGFAGMALLIAVVGVAGVLAFSVSARTREFGIRLAVGSSPRRLLAHVLAEGIAIAVFGIAVGAIGGYGLARLAATVFEQVELPGALPVAVAAAVLIGAAVIASFTPAARASRVDVLQALRSE
jgi:predicted permease